ncbi:hypothetical protein BN1708_020205, partial [Verticillium longisporum]
RAADSAGAGARRKGRARAAGRGDDVDAELRRRGEAKDPAQASGTRPPARPHAGAHACQGQDAGAGCQNAAARRLPQQRNARVRSQGARQLHRHAWQER